MELFKNRIFITILITDLIQQMAIWIRNLSIMFFVMDITNKDPLAISTLNFIEYLPMILFTFIGGVISDKYNPKKLMLLGDFFSLVSFIILGFLVSKGYLWTIFLAVLVSAIVTQFSYPASQKYFKEYIEEDYIESAIGFSQVLSSVFFVVGPFIGSYFYFNFGIDKTLILISILFLSSLILISTLPNKQFEVLETKSYLEDIKLTFEYIKKEEILYLFTKSFLIISFGLGIANNLDIFLVTNRLGLSEKDYQFFSGIAGIGMVVGGVLYIFVSKYIKDIKIFSIMNIIFSFTVFLEGYSTIPILTMTLQFFDNLMGGILSGYIMAEITKITKQEYLCKVNGIISTVMYIGITFGTIVSGFLVKYISIVFAFLLASFSFLICAIMINKSYKKAR